MKMPAARFTAALTFASACAALSMPVSAEPNDIRQPGPHADHTLFAEHRDGWRPWINGHLMLAEAAVEIQANDRLPRFDMAGMPDPLPAMNRVEPVDAQRAALGAGVVPPGFVIATADTIAQSGDIVGIPVSFDPQMFVPVQRPEDQMNAIAGELDAMGLRMDDDGQVIAMTMDSGLLFEFGQSSLSEASFPSLEAMAAHFTATTMIEVLGHTDSVGGEAANEALALRRADIVRNWLIEDGGLAPTQVVAISRGELDPIAANTLENGADNPEGRALNRRVEFIIMQ